METIVALDEGHNPEPGFIVTLESFMNYFPKHNVAAALSTHMWAKFSFDPTSEVPYEQVSDSGLTYQEASDYGVN